LLFSIDVKITNDSNWKNLGRREYVLVCDILSIDPLFDQRIPWLTTVILKLRPEINYRENPTFPKWPLFDGRYIKWYINHTLLLLWFSWSRPVARWAL